MAALFILLLIALPAAIPAVAQDLTGPERVELIRGLTAEFATVKIDELPRSKKPLPFKSDGTYDLARWKELNENRGPAAKSGDLIQITKVKLEDDRIEFEINGGLKSGRRWFDNIQVGMGTRQAPVGASGSPTLGTNLVLLFDKKLPALTAAEVKALMKPILDFERRTVTESYIDTLPPEIKQAIEEKKPLEGMDREQILLALGRPVRKTRETKDGMELEDWIYGQAPGKITFVTFHNGKVIKIHNTYAGLGADRAPQLFPVR